MNIIYNNQQNFTSNISNFLYNCDKNFRKTQMNIIPSIVLGMINSESTVASDIAKNLKDDFSNIQLDSITKRIKRLFNNKLFDPYSFYDKIIKHIFSNFKSKHSDKRVHIIFDHMFCHNNYTIFMISMRIGKQGVPLWFRCFKGYSPSIAFKESLFKEGISYVSNLFPKNYKLIFLADRFFNSTSLMKFIDSLGHTYCIRLQGNLNTFFKDRRNSKLHIKLRDIKSCKNNSRLIYNIPITRHNHIANLVISKNFGVKEPWIIITNGDPKRAIKDYGYRFGGIESIFKNQKSNGFRIESVVNASLKYFESMYSISCFAYTFLVILGSDYTKNSNCYKNVKLTTHKKIKGSIKRVMSLFSVGLTLFKLAFNSSKYIRIPYSFTLYDV